MHRDLKLENLLLVAPRDISRIKIADFGWVVNWLNSLYFYSHLAHQDCGLWVRGVALALALVLLLRLGAVRARNDVGVAQGL